tara:strand:+ start:3447 stop:4526 length:1080 start_codon:yes stop_codon:yes gene_type:complete
MKKITKIGLSALCGSLATFSAANAGGMKVLGNTHATWTNVQGVTGQPLGMKTNLSFVGDGELDGGQTFSVTIAHNDQNAWSSANISLTTNVLGTFKLSSAEGSGGIGGYDDNMPRAFEETWDAGVGTNVNLQKGVGSSTNLSWTTPSKFATTLQLAWSPQNDGSQPTDKSMGGSQGSSIYHDGIDAVLRIKPSYGAFGADWFIGGSKTVQEKTVAGKEEKSADHEEAVSGLTLTLGPISVGGQVSAESTGNEDAGETQYYANSSIGGSLNINDNLSLSYSETRHLTSIVDNTHNAVNTVGQAIDGSSYTPKTTMRGESWQVAYTLGGIALKYAQTEFENVKYTKGSTDEAKVLSLSMAF